MLLSPVQTLAYEDDVLQLLAREIVHAHQAQLPDLSQVVVLLPDPLPAVRLRRLLLQEAKKHRHHALLGPTITTLKKHVESEALLDTPVLSGDARELVLVEALQQHAELFNNGNPWAIADSLLMLFDELSLYQCTLPESLEEFIAQLQQSYGLVSEALSMEARLVHTLWLAWQEQLRANGQVDLNTAYLLRLARHHEGIPANRHYYVAGYAGLYPAEAQWLAPLLQSARARFFLHGRPESEESQPGYPLQQLLQRLGQQVSDSQSAQARQPYSQWLDHVFAPQHRDLAGRSQNIAAQFRESPAQGRLKLLKAESFEQEAQAVVLKVLQIKAQKKQRIGLVIEDRRLARRLRALLERHQIALRDATGWSLSTTSAAAALENWLQCLEEDFAHQPLLDLLKSPFLCDEEQRHDYLKQVYRLEQDLVRYENIPRNLQRYTKALLSRQARLEDVRPFDAQRLLSLLQHLEQAAEPILQIRRRKQPAASWLHALQQSLQKLGLEQGFGQDDSGQQILLVLHDLMQAGRHSKLPLAWSDFRVWLGRSMEKQTFKPLDPHEQYVDLLHLPQSQLGHFEALIIAGVSSEYFPASRGSSPFFNNAVRAELGLPTRQQLLDMQLYHFRRLLDSAPEVLLCFHQGEEENLPSPWFTLLQAFHQLAWGDNLRDVQLEQWLALPQEKLWPEQSTLPGEVVQPRPAMPTELFPLKLSATAHQQLIDCPYAFFSASGLKLQAPEEVREALKKNDYGNRVHKILEAFHAQQDGFPPPFGKPINSSNQHEAEQRLNEICEAVFARDIENNFQHRGWLRRAQRLVPAIIDWEMKRQADEWRFKSAETVEQATLTGKYQVYGRLDRIDQNGDELAVIDYKTGTIPSQEEIERGEAVQLPHYVISMPNAKVSRAEYIKLDGDTLVRRKIETNQLQELSDAVEQRLRLISEAILAGSPLPAWGDEGSCVHCHFRSLCRKDHWQQKDEELVLE